MNSGKPWYKNEEKMLLNNIINATNLDEVAEKHGRNLEAIKYRILKLVFDLKKQKNNVRMISDKLKLPIEIIKKILKEKVSTKELLNDIYVYEDIDNKNITYILLKYHYELENSYNNIPKINPDNKVDIIIKKIDSMRDFLDKQLPINVF